MVSSRCFRCCCLRVSVLGYTLEGDPAVQHALLGTALRHFPIIGPQLQQNISSIHGSRLGVILGIRGAVYGGGVSVALQNAFRGWAWLLYARPNPCAASRWCVWPAVGTLTDRHDFVAAEFDACCIFTCVDWGVCATVIGQMGIRDRPARLASVARAQDPGVRRVRRLAPSAGRLGGCHARSATVAIV